MDIEFRTTKDRKLYSEERRLQKQFGAKLSRVIRRRLDQLRAASCLEDLRRAPGRTHELTGNRTGQIASRLDGNYRLVFVPAEDPPPSLSDGGIDWTRVQSIRIVEVVDYHG